mgnify:CR=1 FL=1
MSLDSIDEGSMVRILFSKYFKHKQFSELQSTCEYWSILCAIDDNVVNIFKSNQSNWEGWGDAASWNTKSATMSTVNSTDHDSNYELSCFVLQTNVLDHTPCSILFNASLAPELAIKLQFIQAGSKLCTSLSTSAEMQSVQFRNEL